MNLFAKMYEDIRTLPLANATTNGSEDSRLSSPVVVEITGRIVFCLNNIDNVIWEVVPMRQTT